MAAILWPLVLGIGWVHSVTGFLAAPSPPPFPPPPAFGGGINGVRNTVAGAAAASTPSATRLPATASASEVSVSVLSPREAVLELPPIDGDGDDKAAGERSGFSIRWFEEDHPGVFDQATASLQSTLVLTLEQCLAAVNIEGARGVDTRMGVGAVLPAASSASTA